jgi:metal-responsive CopG/Arc/MetJ family transcriptional regulator
MKTISIGFEDSLLKAINREAKKLKITRAELIRNALFEYLFEWDDEADAKELKKAMEEDDGEWYSLEDVLKKLKIESSD